MLKRMIFCFSAQAAVLSGFGQDSASVKDFVVNPTPVVVREVKVTGDPASPTKDSTGSDGNSLSFYLLLARYFRL